MARISSVSLYQTSLFDIRLLFLWLFSVQVFTTSNLQWASFHNMQRAAWKFFSCLIFLFFSLIECGVNQSIIICRLECILTVLSVFSCAAVHYYVLPTTDNVIRILKTIIKLRIEAIHIGVIHRPRHAVKHGQDPWTGILNWSVFPTTWTGLNGFDWTHVMDSESNPKLMDWTLPYVFYYAFVVNSECTHTDTALQLKVLLQNISNSTFV